MINDWQHLREYADLAVSGGWSAWSRLSRSKYGGTLRATLAVERVLASSVPAVPDTVTRWLQYGREQSFDAEIGPRQTRLPEGRAIFFRRKADPDSVARYPRLATGYVLLIGDSGMMRIEGDSRHQPELALLPLVFLAALAVAEPVIRRSRLRLALGA